MSRSTAEERSIRRRRAWHARGRAAAGPKSKSPHQQRTSRQKEAPTVGNRKFGGSKREQCKGGPRRAAERKEDPQVGIGPWGGCRLGLVSRADPTSNEASVSPTRSTSRTEIGTSLGSTQDLRIEGAPKCTVLRGCAEDRRKTRGAWASADGSHCSASCYLEWTTPRPATTRRSRAEKQCKPPFRPHSSVSLG